MAQDLTTTTKGSAGYLAASMTLTKITEADLNEFLNMKGMSSINDQTKTTFLKLAMLYNLNPFKNEIYITGYKTKDGKEVYSVVTGYQTFIKIANKTGILDGWEAEPIKESGKLVGARVIIYRKDWTRPFKWEVSLEEFNKGQSTWNSMPEFMIKKVAIGQGFRLCFEGVEGADMSGLYEEAEIVGAEDKEYVTANLAAKKYSELASATSTVGITLMVENGKAVASGNTHANAKLLKGLGFTVASGQWVCPCIDDRPAEVETPKPKPAEPKINDLADLGVALEKLGLELEIKESGGKTYVGAKGVAVGCEEQLIALGFKLGKQGGWGRDVSEFVKQKREKTTLEEEAASLF